MGKCLSLCWLNLDDSNNCLSIFLAREFIRVIIGSAFFDALAREQNPERLDSLFAKRKEFKLPTIRPRHDVIGYAIEVNESGWLQSNGRLNGYVDVNDPRFILRLFEKEFRVVCLFVHRLVFSVYGLITC